MVGTVEKDGEGMKEGGREEGRREGGWREGGREEVEKGLYTIFSG